jgi:hypothetical protein
MTAATWTMARWHACPDGHDDPKTGGPARAVVPDGTGLTPRCTACRQPMTPVDGALTGTWRLDECCVPADPSGRWYGPPRNPAVCSRCYGTQRVAICTTCLLPGCPGTHADVCQACDGEGTVPCETCDGEGHVFDKSGEDEGLCPNPECVAGAVRCPECHGGGDPRTAHRFG